MGRLTEPEDVANTIGWLASDEAGFVTGVCLEVDEEDASNPLCNGVGCLMESKVKVIYWTY